MTPSRSSGTPGDRRMHSIGEALERLSAELGLDANRSAISVQERWPEVVGDRVAEHARPRRLRDGTLVVEVDSPAWATEIRFLGTSLTDRLNEAAGAVVVRRIEVVVARPR